MPNFSIKSNFIEDNQKLILTSVFVFLIMFLYSHLSEGTYQDDDIGHFLISKWSWQHPELLLSVWGRPAYTVAYFIPSQFGIYGARVFTNVLASLTCFIAGTVAKNLKMERYYLVPFFIAMQPLYLTLSFSLLTEIIFGFILITGVMLLESKKYVLSSLTMSLLPLSRHEGIIIFIIWAFIYFRQKQILPFLLLFTSLIIYNTISLVATGTLPFLIYSNPNQTSIYGSGNIAHYFIRFPFLTGFIILFLFEIGFIKEIIKKSIFFIYYL